MSRAPFQPSSRRRSTDVGEDLGDAIRRRSASVHARLRVSDTMHDLALDIVGAEALSTNDRSRLMQALDDPVNEATEEALRVLVQELVTAIRSAPDGVRPSIGSTVVSRTDFE
ncbi:MAG: hypothetical protein ACXWXF_12355 [Aeromicrobium sp.]